MNAVRAVAILAVAVVSSVGMAKAGTRAGEERWSAGSHPGMGITGDISLSPSLLVAAGRRFPLRVAADVAGFPTDQGPQAVRILKVTSAMNPVLLNGNRFCTGPVGWIAVYRSDGGTKLNMAVFTGPARPVKEDTPTLCGTYMYVR